MKEYSSLSKRFADMGKKNEIKWPIKGPMAPGKSGQKTRMRTNWFKVHFKKDVKIFMYDVKFTGGDREISEQVRRQAMDIVCETKGKEDFGAGVLPAYDGANLLYSPTELKFGGRIVFENVMGRYNVLIEKTIDIDMNTLQLYMEGKQPEGPHQVPQAVQAIDTAVFNRALLDSDNTMSTRSAIFRVPSSSDIVSIDRGQFKQIWKGYTTSFRPTVDGLLLNLDLTFGAFIATGTNLISLVQHVIRREPRSDTRLDSRDVFQIEKQLKNKPIFVTHMKYKKKYKIVGLDKNSANSKFFDLTDEAGNVISKKSVAEYFADAYGMKLRYPELPLVKVHPKKKDICLPLEVCVFGQKRLQRTDLTPQEEQEVIKKCCLKPFQREQAIVKERKADRFESNYMNSYGISIDKRIMEVNGRILACPTLKYARQIAPLRTNIGKWDLRDQQLNASPKSLVAWGVAVAAPCSEGEVRGSVESLVRMCNTMGLRTEFPSITLRSRNQSISDLLKTAGTTVVNKHKYCQLLVVIKQTTDSKEYEEIKFTSDSIMGVPSQVLVQNKFIGGGGGGGRGGRGRGRGGRGRGGGRGGGRRGPSPQYLSNGGRNSVLKSASTPSGLPFPSRWKSDASVMFLGADVNHPSIGSIMVSGDKIPPSISALVGSLDNEAAVYSGTFRLQTGRKEIIVDMKDMFKTLLKQRRVLPRYVVMYRDGVGEGMFQEVLEEELDALKDACAEFKDGYCPLFTFVCTQKRHHTTFFPLDPRSNQADRSGNVSPGTVVDAHLIDPNRSEFFMMSHAGIQGTSRCTKYIVLYDENGFKTDEIQLLSYHLCYLMCRSTTSVSLPVPAKYADILAMRGRVLLNGRQLVGSGGNTAPGVIHLTEHSRVSKLMYYV